MRIPVLASCIRATPSRHLNLLAMKEKRHLPVCWLYRSRFYDNDRVPSALHFSSGIKRRERDRGFFLSFFFFSQFIDFLRLASLLCRSKKNSYVIVSLGISFAVGISEFPAVDPNQIHPINQSFFCAENYYFSIDFQQVSGSRASRVNSGSSRNMWAYRLQCVGGGSNSRGVNLDTCKSDARHHAFVNTDLFCSIEVCQTCAEGSQSFGCRKPKINKQNMEQQYWLSICWKQQSVTAANLIKGKQILRGAEPSG